MFYILHLTYLLDFECHWNTLETVFGWNTAIALSLALYKGIPVAVTEKALNQFDRYRHELPRWFDAKQSYAREVLHATTPERLATLPKIELEFLLNIATELEDYESASILDKVLSVEK